MVPHYRRMSGLPSDSVQHQLQHRTITYILMNKKKTEEGLLVKLNQWHKQRHPVTVQECVMPGTTYHLETTLRVRSHGRRGALFSELLT